MSINRRDISKLMLGAVGGILAGCQTSGTATDGGMAKMSATSSPAEKHACKGMNDCKGNGGCETGDNGCASKNSCKGHGGCATVAKHDCKGKNDCKGQGGCKPSDNGCAGKNSCKGNGGCKVPVEHL